MRLWFVAHAPSVGEGGKAQGRGVAEAQYKQFAQHLGAGFAQGRRFVDDVAVGPLGDEDEQG